MLESICFEEGSWRGTGMSMSSPSLSLSLRTRIIFSLSVVMEAAIPSYLTQFLESHMHYIVINTFLVCSVWSFVQLHIVEFPGGVLGH